MKRFIFLIIFFAVTLFSISLAAQLSFNPNHYRDPVKRVFLSRWGIDAKIGYAIFEWLPHPRITVQRLILKDSGTRKTLLNTKSLVLKVDIFSTLLRRKIVIRDFILENPKLALILPKAPVKDPSDKKIPLMDDFIQNGLNPSGYCCEINTPRLFVEHGQLRIEETSLTSVDRITLPKVSLKAEWLPDHTVRFILFGELALENLNPSVYLRGSYQTLTRELDLAGKVEDVSTGQTAVDFNGTIINFDTKSEFLAQGSIRLHQVPIREYFPGFFSSTLSGIATAQLEGSLRGRGLSLDWAQSKFEGAADIRRGVFLNSNFVWSVLDGLGPNPPESLPVEISDTGRLPFDAAQFQILAENGRIELNEILVKHHDYLLTGSGYYEIPDAETFFSLKLIALGRFAESLLRRHEALQNLSDAGQNRLAIPFEFREDKNRNTSLTLSVRSAESGAKPAAQATY